MAFRLFLRSLTEVKPFGIVISFKSVHNDDQWFMVNVGPCQGALRDEFVNWLYNLQVEPEQNWMLLGDFNFIRSLDN